VRRVGNLTVYEGLAEVPQGMKSVATIGVFDGVHRGHQALIRTVIERARQTGATPAVVTFDRHPLEVIAPGKEPQLITTLPQRARVMERIGVEALVVLPFDDGLRHLSPEEFVREVIIGALGCVHVVIGANFRFGYGQAGTIETLTDLGARYGFGVSIFALQMAEADVVSSTMIRRHIAEGLVEKVAEELDRPYVLEGVVERGAGRGKGLGVPTANLRVPDRMILPKLGVYAGWLRVKGERLPMVCNVGVNPTFGDRTTPIVEAHVLDFDADLYGQVVEIEFTHRLRDEMRFEDVDALIVQMQRDIEQARALLRA
jgi:riboflavin kinase / FMN adenylyltransferase